MKVNYLSRDWESLNKMVRSYAQRYYPNAVEDQSEASFNSMLFGVLSLFGDQLSFYSDYYANEEFLSSCTEFDSVLKHGRQSGFVPFIGNTAIGQVSFFAEVPTSAITLGPDPDYYPVLEAGSTITSKLGVNFILTEDVVWTDSDVRVGKVDPNTGAPTTYILKSYGVVVSGQYKTEEFVLTDFQTFLKLRLDSPNVAEILTITDSGGNEYYQVNNLSQNLVYKAQTNYSGSPRSTLIPIAAPRRFVFSRDSVSYYLIFGSGSDNVDFDVYTETPQMGINIYGKKYVSSFDMDPNKIAVNDKFGIAPSDTTLTVVYRTINTDTINVGIGSINTFLEKNVKIFDEHLLDQDKVNTVKDSIYVINEKPIVGFTTYDSLDELKERTIGHNNCQDRAVTELDYINTAYKMPKNFGSIKRCGASTSFVGNRTFMNLFVVSEDDKFKLVQTGDEIKQNLIEWVKTKKMSTDNINIFDCQIVNLGFSYEIIVEKGYNKVEVLNNTLNYIRNYYFKTFNVGENFDITTIFSELSKIRGVIDVSKINVYQKLTGDYSAFEYDLDDNLTVDGKSIEAKANVIFEIKYPFNDIVGAAK